MRLQNIILMYCIASVIPSCAGPVMSRMQRQNNTMMQQGSEVDRSYRIGMKRRLQFAMSRMESRMRERDSRERGSTEYDMTPNYAVRKLAGEEPCCLICCKACEPGNHHRLACAHAICTECWPQFVRFKRERRVGNKHEKWYRCPYNCGIAEIDNYSG